MTREEDEKIVEHFNNIIYFEGNLDEYERWKDYKCGECEILEPNFNHIPTHEYGIRDSDRELYKKGIEAVVNYRKGEMELYYHSGIPVKRKVK